MNIDALFGGSEVDAGASRDSDSSLSVQVHAGLSHPSSSTLAPDEDEVYWAGCRMNGHQRVRLWEGEIERDMELLLLGIGAWAGSR
jgi:hypothetical protein